MRWIIEICVWKDFIWLRGTGALAGLWGERERVRERAHTHVCVTFMCTSDRPLCQDGDTSHVNRFWLTSPRSAGGLAHCRVWALLCGSGVQLRGQRHSLCRHLCHRGWSRPAVRVSVCACVCVFALWLTGRPVAGSHCCCPWHCTLPTLTLALFVFVSNPPNPHHHHHNHLPLAAANPPLPPTPVSCRHLHGFELFPCSDTRHSSSISSNHSVLITFTPPHTNSILTIIIIIRLHKHQTI